jgi:hypothetical protein
MQLIGFSNQNTQNDKHKKKNHLINMDKSILDLPA